MPPCARLDAASRRSPSSALQQRPELAPSGAPIARERAASSSPQLAYWPDFELSVGRFVNFGAADGFGAMASVTVPFVYGSKYDAGISEARGALSRRRGRAAALAGPRAPRGRAGLLRVRTAPLPARPGAAPTSRRRSRRCVSPRAPTSRALDFLSLLDTLRTIERVHLEHIDSAGRLRQGLRRARARRGRPALDAAPTRSEAEPCACAHSLRPRPVVARRAGCRRAAAGIGPGASLPPPPPAPPRGAEVPVRHASADRLRPAGHLPDLPDEAPARRRGTPPPPRGAGAGTPLFYRHPMRPDVTSPVPAKDEMGMDYIPVYADDPRPRAAVPGHAGFTLSSERQQLIGVRRAASSAPLTRESAPSAPSPTTRPLPGGRRLPRGAPGRSAVRRRARWRRRTPGPTPSCAPRRCACASSASPRRRRAPSPAAGRPGRSAAAGQDGWVYAQVYEYEIDPVHPGQTVTITTAGAARPHLPRPRRRGRSDPRPRDPHRAGPHPGADARGGLRPEGFVQATIHVPSGSVAVPTDAVLHTGAHQIVFVVERRRHASSRAPCSSAARRAATTKSLAGLARARTWSPRRTSSSTRSRASAPPSPLQRRSAAAPRAGAPEWQRHGRTHHRVQRPQPLPRAAAHRRRAGRRAGGRCGTFRSTPSPTSPTRR